MKYKPPHRTRKEVLEYLTDEIADTEKLKKQTNFIRGYRFGLRFAQELLKY